MKTYNRACLFAALTAAASLLPSFVVGAADRFYSGYVKRELYLDNGGGTAVGDLTADPNYPANPGFVDYRLAIESPDEGRSNYGGRLSGFIIPAANGSVIF